MPTIARHLHSSMPLHMQNQLISFALKMVCTHTRLWHIRHMQWYRQPGVARAISMLQIAMLSLLLKLAVRR